MEVLALISTLGLTWSRIRLAFVGISVTLAATACSLQQCSRRPPRLTGHWCSNWPVR